MWRTYMVRAHTSYVNTTGGLFSKSAQALFFLFHYNFIWYIYLNNKNTLFEQIWKHNFKIMYLSILIII